MKKIIHTVTDEEHGALRIDGKRTFSVRLSLEVNELGDGEGLTDIRGAYALFIRQLVSLSNNPKNFAIYSVNSANGEMTRLDAPTYVVLSAVYNTNLADAFISWFKQRVEKLKTQGVGAPTPRDDLADDEVTGFHALMGAATWAAPIPHELGLTHVITVNKGILLDDQNLAVVPLIDGIKPIDPQSPSSGTLIDITLEAGAAYGCMASVSAAPHNTDTLLNDCNGFINKPVDDRIDGPEMRWIEQRAGSLFTGFLAAAEIKWPESFDTNPPPLPANDWSLPEDHLQLRCLAWQTAAMISAAFDTVLLALFMPGAENREGQLLGPFLEILVRDGLINPDAPDAPKTEFAKNPINLRRRKFRGAVREGLQEFVNKLRFIGDNPPKISVKDIWELSGLADDNTRLALEFFNFAYSPTREKYVELWRKIEELLSPSAKIKKSNINRDDIKRQLAGELATLNDTMLSEAGIERVLVELLKRPEVRDKVANLWWDNNPPEAEMVEKSYSRCIASIRNFLAGNVNGAEGARQSVGSLIADMMAAPGKELFKDFWKNRLTEGLFKRQKKTIPPAANPVSHPIFINLAPSLNYIFSTMEYQFKERAIKISKAAVDAASQAMSEDAAKQLKPSTARFIPESSPGPLFVQIPLDPTIDDDDGIDEITASFAGLAVLSRRTGGNWAYACLAEALEPEQELQEPDEPYTPSAARLSDGVFSIAPLPSAVVDNRRELFLSYDGLPFAANAYNGAIAREDMDQGVTPFHVLDYPDADKLKDYGKFDQLEPLAYGTNIDFAVHVVGRSGLLPTNLRGTAPWLPKPAPDKLDDYKTATFPVSRRTAIGRAAISGVRIGKRPEGLFPLSSDYLRIAVEQGVKSETLRNNDGTGAFTLPSQVGDSRTLVLRDIEVWSDNAVSLTVGIGIDVAAAANPVIAFSASVKGGAAVDLAVTFTRIAPKVVKVSATLGDVPTVDNGTFYPDEWNGVWLRLNVDKDAVSMADPGTESGEKAATARPAPDNLLLLGASADKKDLWPNVRNTAANDESLWKAAYNEKTTIDVSLPRMTFQDFMRWTNNPKLAKAAMGLGAHASMNDPRLKRLEAFRTLLVALDMDRLRKPVEAEWLDRLPDLAVCEVQLTASPVDSLIRKPGEMGISDKRARRASKQYTMPTLHSLLAPHNLLDDNNELNPKAKLVDILQNIDKVLRPSITVSSSSADAGELKFSSPEGVESLTIPGGLTVRLSARAAVRNGYFDDNGEPPVIDNRMRELAVREDGGLFVFDGSHLVIETMIGPLVSSVSSGWKRKRNDWALDREKLLAHKSYGLARRYDITLTPHHVDDWTWRQVGQSTTQTQAWRFSGKPIYTWIDPHKFAPVPDSTPGPRATLRMLSCKIDDQFKAFEQDLFRDRDDDDAQPRTVQMLPLGRENRLVTVEADAHRGATFYRHALEIRSRYAAAMRLPGRHGTCQAWNDQKDIGPADMWMRIAVLAPRPVGDLTRPQLRALLPLTRRPDAKEDSATMAPPVLAMLQEEPLAFGGLAARITTEIRTGVGYSAQMLISDPGKTVVAPSDARKEIGPDPRLSYRAMESGAARRAVLTPEGPIGLTFERDATAGAGFANTALILHPELLDRNEGDKVPEESFISVGMRRYLDPAWLIPELKVIEAGPMPLDRGALWIDAEQALCLDFKFDAVSESPKIIKAVTFENGKILVDRRAVDETADLTIPQEHNGDNNPLNLCDVPEGFTLVLLVIPQDKGRLSVSFMVSHSFDPTAPERGAGMTPFTLAGLELSVPENAVVILNKGKVRLTAASTPTALNWIRTNQDFGKITTTAQGVDKTLDAGNLVARYDKTNNTLSFERTDSPGVDIWIRTMQALSRTPTHVQRHIVVLLSETLRGVGRDIERPLSAWLAPAAVVNVSSVNDGILDRVDTVRIIEIETPAELMGWLPNPALLPERYRHAFFDLASIGARRSLTEGKRFLFRLRHVGANKTLPTGTIIKLGLMTSSREELSVEIALADSDVVELFFEVNSVPNTSYVGAPKIVWALTKKGVLKSFDTKPQEPTDKQIEIQEAVILSIKSISSGATSAPYDAESWFETSMLVVPLNKGYTLWRFDFDWLFGAEKPKPSLYEIFNLDRLAERAEAQARVIKVSPPIEVRMR